MFHLFCSTSLDLCHSALCLFPAIAAAENTLPETATPRPPCCFEIMSVTPRGRRNALLQTAYAARVLYTGLAGEDPYFVASAWAGIRVARDVMGAWGGVPGAESRSYVVARRCVLE